MNINTEQKRQVDVLCRYLLGAVIDNDLVYGMYVEANHERAHNEKVVDFAFRHPRLLPFLDGGLVFIRPNSELRRRIHVVFATLESMPEYSSKFLPEKVSFVQFLYLILVGIRGTFRAVIGILIIKVARL